MPWKKYSVNGQCGGQGLTDRRVSDLDDALPPRVGQPRPVRGPGGVRELVPLEGEQVPPRGPLPEDVQAARVRRQQPPAPPTSRLWSSRPAFDRNA